MRKRKHVIPLHLNAKELRHLNELVNISKCSREEFLRMCIMGAQIRAKPCVHHADLLHKVAGLCNNANQLAHQANANGNANSKDVDNMLNIANGVHKYVKENW